MSGKNNDYIYLAYLTEPRRVGESTKRSPQHLTLVPPFPADKPVEELVAAVSEVASSTKPIQVKVAKEARLGPNKNINVVIVEPADVVGMLHYQLMYAMDSIGVSLPEKYVYETFLPHITIKPAHTTHLKKGQMITIDHIAIMHKNKGSRTLLAKEDLTR